MYAPRDFTILHYACVDDEPALVELLLRRGADVRASSGVRGKRCARGGIYPLSVACANECHGVERVIFAHLKREKRRKRLLPLIVLVEQCSRCHEHDARAKGRWRRARRRGWWPPRAASPAGAAVLWLATLDKYLRRGIMKEVCSYL